MKNKLHLSKFLFFSLIFFFFSSCLNQPDSYNKYEEGTFQIEITTEIEKLVANITKYKESKEIHEQRANLMYNFTAYLDILDQKKEEIKNQSPDLVRILSKLNAESLNELSENKRLSTFIEENELIISTENENMSIFFDNDLFVFSANDLHNLNGNFLIKIENYRKALEKHELNLDKNQKTNFINDSKEHFRLQNTLYDLYVRTIQKPCYRSHLSSDQIRINQMNFSIFIEINQLNSRVQALNLENLKEVLGEIIGLEEKLSLFYQLVNKDDRFQGCYS